jgi:hypothetical protein
MASHGERQEQQNWRTKERRNDDRILIGRRTAAATALLRHELLLPDRSNTTASNLFEPSRYGKCQTQKKATKPNSRILPDLRKLNPASKVTSNLFCVPSYISSKRNTVGVKCRTYRLHHSPQSCPHAASRLHISIPTGLHSCPAA